MEIDEAMQLFNDAMAQIESITEQVHQDAEDAEASAGNAADSASAAQDAAQTALSASIKRRYVVLSDSYGQGWTPDGSVESWITKLRTIMAIADGDIFSVSEGGCGFWVGDSSDVRYLPNMLDRAYSVTTNPETITDILIAIGYNDINANNESAMRSNAASLLTKIRQLFPQTPRVWLLGIGYTTNHANQFKLMSGVYKAYMNFPGYGFQKLTNFLCQKAYFSSDGIHPNDAGQASIAQAISQVLNNSTAEPYEYQSYAFNTNVLFKTPSGGDMNGPIYVYREGRVLHITCPTNNYLRSTFASDARITLSRTSVKIGTYENLLLTGFHNWSAYGEMAPCSIIYRADGLAGYHCIDGYINIAPENDNDNTLYVWLSIFATTEDFTNYLSVANVFEVQVGGFSLDLEQIG